MLGMCEKIKAQVKEFRSHEQLIQVLCNPGMRPRHWKKMSEVVGANIAPDPSSTLQRMINLNLGEKLEELEAVSASASKEFSLEKAMDRMEEEWRPMQFNAVPYRDTGMRILSSVDEIQVGSRPGPLWWVLLTSVCVLARVAQTQLDDHLVKTQTMRGSPFIKPFQDRIVAWERTLVATQEIIEGWLKVQATWLYLEPIFSSPDIMAQARAVP
jgi:dynein heavy chain